MTGLTDKTAEVFKKISNFDFFKEYTFIGGSALAVQINHRLSEDLDFCKWKTGKNDKPVVDTSVIDKHFSELEVQDKNILGFNQVEYYLKNKVKISFYANQLYKSPVKERINVQGNIYASDVESIGVMKLELMLRRSNFRDYYDIYSILKNGSSIKRMIYNAGKYSNQTLKSKNIISFISNGENYTKEKNFEKLNPKYNVDGKEIEKYIKSCIEKEFQNLRGNNMNNNLGLSK